MPEFQEGLGTMRGARELSRQLHPNAINGSALPFHQNCTTLLDEPLFVLKILEEAKELLNLAFSLVRHTDLRRRRHRRYSL